MAANLEVEQFLREWEVGTTEQLLMGLEHKRQIRMEEENRLRVKEEEE